MAFTSLLPVAPPDLLQAALEVSLTGFILFRPVYEADQATITDLAYVYLNPAAQRWLHLPECPAESFRTRYPGALDTGIFAFYRDTFLAGQPGRYDVNYQHDGLDSYCQLAARRAGDLLVVSFSDTADQPRTAVEEARARAERERQHFHDVLWQLPAQVATYQGPHHVFSFVNERFSALAASPGLLGRPVREAAPGAGGPEVAALLDHVYTTGESVHLQEVEVRLAKPAPAQPHSLFINACYLPLRDSEGRPYGVLNFSYDVTEQVRARQAQEAQQQELAQLFRQAPAPIVILDGPALVFQLVNPAYQRIFPGRELVDKPLLEALPELVDTPIPGLLRQVYQTGEPVVVQELPLMMARHEGQALEEIYWTFTYQARRDAHGVIDGVRVFAHDVTEQVRARHAVATSAQQAQALAANLAEANQQLTRVNVDLDTFVYAASHDLKTPIANIEGLLSLLREYLPPAAQVPLVPRLVGMMEQSIARFQQTVAHLTDISRLSHLPPEQPAEALDIPQLLEDVRLDLQPLLESAGAELAIAVDTCPGVHFSASNLRSVFFHLLSNAAKCRAPNRALLVHVRTHCTDEQLVLEVQDNGLGMSEQQQSHLFTMFRRLHTHVEGSGVGLYLMKRTIENAGGTITVQSQPDAGSTFTVTLPRA